MPGAPRQTLYCSVSLRPKRRPGGGGDTSGPRTTALVRAVGRQLRDRALDELDEPLVLEVPGRREHDVAGHVHRAVVAGDRRLVDGGDHLGRADHGPAERVVAEDGLGEQVVDELARRVLDHRDLLEHDLALGLELGEDRLEDHLGHHVERDLELLVGHARVDDRVLAARGRVQLAAERVEGLRDLLRRVRGGALEEQVLDQVRDPGLRRRSRRGSRRRSRSRARPSGRGRAARSRCRSPESSSVRVACCTG